MNVPMRSREVPVQSLIASAPQKLTSVHVTSDSKGFLPMVSAATKRVIQRKGFALWQFIRYAISGVNFWVGGQFLFGGDHVQVEPTYHLLSNIEGGTRVHGLILVGLAFMFASKPAVKYQLVYSLFATLFYSILTTCLIIGGWMLHKPDLTAPALPALVSVLCIGLIMSANGGSAARPATGGGSSA